jgi:steroid delta-isomerase-like uncharacterized protein
MSSNPKAVYSRFNEIINDRSADGVDEVCAPDMVGHAGAGTNLAEFKQSYQAFADAFSDLQAEIRYLVGEGDLVSAWLTWKGTHTGEFAGVPGTGREMSIAGWDLVRVKDGRIVELTQYCDVFTLLNQIGALATAAPA